ncbi:hypothetical protein V8C34DRAFT_121217 [Trichoderma compactum]
MHMRPTEVRVQAVVVHASCTGAPADALVHRHGTQTRVSMGMPRQPVVSICVSLFVRSVSSFQQVKGQWPWCLANGTGRPATFGQPPFTNLDRLGRCDFFLSPNPIPIPRDPKMNDDRALCVCVCVCVGSSSLMSYSCLGGGDRNRCRGGPSPCRHLLQPSGSARLFLF